MKAIRLFVYSVLLSLATIVCYHSYLVRTNPTVAYSYITQTTRTDGYVFETKDLTYKSRKLEFVFYKDRDSLQRRFKDPKLAAMSLLFKDGTCQVHLVDPASSYEPQYGFHEIMHCLWGQWHPHQDLPSK